MKVSSIILIFYLSFLKTSAQTILSYNFICANDRIIVSIPTNGNEKLNFLFDTGSNNLLIDSTIAARYNLFGKNARATSYSVANGTIKTWSFENKSLFKDSVLNKIFHFEKITSFDQKELKSTIPIHGIMGINYMLQAYCICIDFVNNKLMILAKTPTINPGSNIYQIDMIKPDNGHESLLSKYYKGFPSAKIEYKFSNNMQVKTNALFDTGCNQEMVIYSSENIDSLLKMTNKNYQSTSKKVSLGGAELKIFQFDADTIIIDDGKLPIKSNHINLVKVRRGTTPEFGNLQTIGLIGVAFLKRFKQILFDFPNMKAYFISYD